MKAMTINALFSYELSSSLYSLGYGSFVVCKRRRGSSGGS